MSQRIPLISFAWLALACQPAAPPPAAQAVQPSPSGHANEVSRGEVGVGEEGARQPSVFPAQTDLPLGSLRFRQRGAEFAFDTGVLKGTLRASGESNGLAPVTFGKNNVELIAEGPGLLNHYRVFSRGKRYGYGARRWPSTAKLQPDGSVEVHWPATAARPFELRAQYRLAAPNIVDLTTSVSARDRLEGFEVFLASYFLPSFGDSRVSSTSLGGEAVSGFVSAEQALGDWLAFPRDSDAEGIIRDGRWELEPHPLAWTLMPPYDRPVAIRRNGQAGVVVVAVIRREDCFGVFTPYAKEKHFSHYFSLFGDDLDAGVSASAEARLIVLSGPTEAEILQLADDYLASPRR